MNSLRFKNQSFTFFLGKYYRVDLFDRDVELIILEKRK